jgi:triacylglycerol lipase
MAHGFWDTGAVFGALARDLRAAGFVPHHPTFRPRDGRLGLEDLAHKLSVEIEEHVPEGQKCALVGFSMGTLVSRFYLQRLGGLERVHTFFSIAGPHAGTRTAYLYPGQATREMRPDSTLLRDLNADIERLVDLPVFSYWTPYDFMIFPPTSSLLPVGENVRVDCWLHPLMVWNREVRAHIRNTLVGTCGGLGTAGPPPRSGSVFGKTDGLQE